MKSLQTVLQFIKAINFHDVDALIEFLTDDHIFIDSWGTRFEGKKTLREGWQTYFSWFPDYRIEIEHILESGDEVIIFGSASGTYHGGPETHVKERFWNLPAAWRAAVREERIKQWQVYVDTKIPLDIIEKFSGSPPSNQHASG